MLLLCLPLSESDSLPRPQQQRGRTEPAPRETRARLKKQPCASAMAKGSGVEEALLDTSRPGGGLSAREEVTKQLRLAAGGPHDRRRAAAERHPDDLRHVRRSPRRAPPRRSLHGQLLRHRHRPQPAASSSRPISLSLSLEVHRSSRPCGTTGTEWSSCRFRWFIAPRSPSLSRRTKVSAVAFICRWTRTEGKRTRCTSFHSLMPEPTQALAPRSPEQKNKQGLNMQGQNKFNYVSCIKLVNCLVALYSHQCLQYE